MFGNWVTFLMDEIINMTLKVQSYRAADYYYDQVDFKCISPMCEISAFVLLNAV